MSDRITLGVAAGIVLLLAAWNIHGPGVAGGSPQRAQEALQAQVEIALTGVRADWARVEMHGQQAVLAGAAPSELDVLIARGAVRSAAGGGGWLWGGVTSVNSDRVRVAPPREGPYPWQAELDASRLLLTGVAPSRETAANLASLAGALFADRRVVDDLEVDPLPPDEGWEEAARGALAVLSHLHVGAATLADFELTVSGEAASEAEAEAARLAMSRLDGIIAATSRVEVETRAPPAPVSPPAPAAPSPQSRSLTPAAATAPVEPAARAADRPAADCQAELDSALAEGVILFDVGSAALSAESAPVLEDLAAIAIACPPFELRIEGHTDDTGVPALNQSLSERRARAVRDRLAGLGVDPARLSAVGRGASEPVGENETAEGRRANRRIEIVVEQ
jgi:OOP family OmpA-OmpF porin